jgi:acyl carrier protein
VNTTNIAHTLETIVRRFAPRDRAAMPLISESSLTVDAGIDSPRMIDLVLGVEDEFGITVNDLDIERVNTFGDLVDMVGERVREAA